MGQEILKSQFSTEDFEEFQVRLARETQTLSGWFDQGRFSNECDKGGFELEAWLVDGEGSPAPVNRPFLDKLANPLVVPELASFNVELNSSPVQLHGNAFRRMRAELESTVAGCQQVADSLGVRMALIGILPTVTPEQLTLANMSPLARYQALNNQVLRLREGQPLKLDIHGREDLLLEHDDVMLESAATSFQIHLKVPMHLGARYYNLSKIISAPMVAACANSPYLFGKELWDETRIPLFEQSVSVGGSDYSKRVTFGVRYARDSLMECFRANLQRYPVLLPMIAEGDPDELPHLRMHNGTIWRWTRPLIGVDEDGTPHLRIEHRVVPAGPTVIDTIANAALFFGLAQALVSDDGRLETDIPFQVAMRNFYESARRGLAAEIEWPAGTKVSIADLLSESLLPKAREGLLALQIDVADVDELLDIIAERVRSGMNGASWQRAWVRRNGHDMRALTAAYLDCQTSGAPVHEWPLSC